MRLLAVVVVTSALVGSMTCSINSHGDLAASKFGDTSRPATRGSPFGELRQACGSEGAMLATTSTIRREPYVQQVTPTSAYVGWVTTAPAGQAVEVSTPAGAVVASASAEPDSVIVRSADETQVWARAEGLAPDTIYCYRVIENGAPLSERIGFRTPPTADSTRPIGILAFGDSGTGQADQAVLRQVMDDVPYQVAIHTGDLAYDDGTIDQIENNVFAVYKELFKHIPFYPAAGNHDYHAGQEAPFFGVFKLPENGHRERWYSYDWGRVHFVALDTQHDYATQAAWLDEDLAATQLPWKIVYMHKPPYSSGHHGSEMALRKAIEPVLARHGVQLVLAGHDHNYERTAPQNGVTHIVTGGGGRSTRAVGVSPFTAFSEAVIHLVYLEVGVDELVVHAIDGEGTEFDSVVIRR